MEKSTLFDTLVVVKRSGQRTSFQREKIAIAIKKAFDSVDTNYQEEDINKVYETVLKNIEKEYENRKTIQIEDIQDFIEEILKKKNYEDVFNSFKTYRERRNASRKSFVTKQQHKFLKSIEALGLHDKEEINLSAQKNPNELLENYGMTIATGFAKSYLLDTKIVRAIDTGLIAIPHLEAIALGSIESIQLDVTRLLKEKISLVKDFQEEIVNIEDFLQFLFVLIKAVSNTVHGQIQIPNIDNDVTPFVLETYKECLKEEIHSFLEYSGLKCFLSFDRISKEVDKIESINDEMTLLGDLYENDELLKIHFKKAENLARKKLEHRIQISTSHFLFNLNSIDDKTNFFPKISMGFGTETNQEAKIFIHILLQLEKNHSYHQPTYCFKLKSNKNLNEKDENYPLLEEYLSIALRTRRFLFANLEMKQNKKYYEEENPSSETCYFSDGSRVIEDLTVQDARITGGKGNLLTCSINLPRLGFKARENHQNIEKDFFDLLEQSLELAKDALLSCFELFCNKHRTDFPFLLGQNIWQDGKNIKEKDRLRKIFKHGTLSIHFVGLEEVLSLLTQDEKNSSSQEKLAIKILEFMQRKINSYCRLNNLNFTLSAKMIPEVCLEFNQIDAAIYGKVKGITSQGHYHNAFQRKLNHWQDTLKIEGKYHSYTNGGHISCFFISKKESSSIDTILKTIQKEAIGAFFFQEKD